MFGMEDLTEPQESQEKATISYFMLSLMQIADQAKIIHWQTGLDTEQDRKSTRLNSSHRCSRMPSSA